jgi:hypothetical protein
MGTKSCFGASVVFGAERGFFGALRRHDFSRGFQATDTALSLRLCALAWDYFSQRPKA